MIRTSFMLQLSLLSITVTAMQQNSSKITIEEYRENLQRSSIANEIIAKEPQINTTNLTIHDKDAIKKICALLDQNKELSTLPLAPLDARIIVGQVELRRSLQGWEPNLYAHLIYHRGRGW